MKTSPTRPTLALTALLLAATLSTLLASSTSSAAPKSLRIGLDAEEKCAHEDAQRLRLTDGSSACVYAFVVPANLKSTAAARESESDLVKRVTNPSSKIATMAPGRGKATSVRFGSDATIVVRAFGKSEAPLDLEHLGIEEMQVAQSGKRAVEPLPSSSTKGKLVALPDITSLTRPEVSTPFTLAILTQDRQYLEFAARTAAQPKPEAKKPETTIPTKLGKPADEGCLHDTAVQIPLEGQEDRIACVYVVNAKDSELEEFQNQDMDEKELSDWLGRCEECEDVHAYQTAPHTQWKNRVSSATVLLVRIFGEHGLPMQLDAAKGIELRIYANEELRHTSKPSGTGISLAIPMSNHVKQGDYGAPIRVEVLHGDKKQGDRYNWYRPKGGWALDYTIATFAVTADDFTFDNPGKLGFAPAMVRFQRRWYIDSDARSHYVFWNIVNLGPIIATPTTDNSDASGLQAPGLIGTTGIDIGGFDVGFGAMLNWGSGSRLQPVVTLNLTEAFTRAFGWSGKFPDSLVEGSAGKKN